MADFALDRPGVWWFAGIVWQSGALLLLGLAASAALRRRPARAHRVLLLAMAGAIVAPMASQVARIQGWGLWSAVAVDRPGIPGSPAPTIVASAVPASPVPRPDGLRPERRTEERAAPTDVATSTPTAAIPTVPERSAVRTGPSISLGGVLLACWGLLSGLCLARLVASTIAGTPGHRPGPTGRGRGDGSSRPDRRGQAGARRGPGAPRVSARPLPGRLVLGSSADHPVARARPRRHRPSIGSASSATSWPTGCGETSGRDCSPRSSSAFSRGIRWRGWPGIG